MTVQYSCDFPPFFLCVIFFCCLFFFCYCYVVILHRYYHRNDARKENRTGRKMRQQTYNKTQAKHALWKNRKCILALFSFLFSQDTKMHHRCSLLDAFHLQTFTISFSIIMDFSGVGGVKTKIYRLNRSLSSDWCDFYAIHFFFYRCFHFFFARHFPHFVSSLFFADLREGGNLLAVILIIYIFHT